MPRLRRRALREEQRIQLRTNFRNLKDKVDEDDKAAQGKILNIIEGTITEMGETLEEDEKEILELIKDFKNFNKEKVQDEAQHKAADADRKNLVIESLEEKVNAFYDAIAEESRVEEARLEEARLREEEARRAEEARLKEEAILREEEARRTEEEAKIRNKEAGERILEGEEFNKETNPKKEKPFSAFFDEDTDSEPWDKPYIDIFSSGKDKSKPTSEKKSKLASEKNPFQDLLHDLEVEDKKSKTKDFWRTGDTKSPDASESDTEEESSEEEDDIFGSFKSVSTHTTGTHSPVRVAGTARKDVSSSYSEEDIFGTLESAPTRTSDTPRPARVADTARSGGSPIGPTRGTPPAIPEMLDLDWEVPVEGATRSATGRPVDSSAAGASASTFTDAQKREIRKKFNDALDDPELSLKKKIQHLHDLANHYQYSAEYAAKSDDEAKRHAELEDIKKKSKQYKDELSVYYAESFKPFHRKNSEETLQIEAAIATLEKIEGINPEPDVAGTFFENSNVLELQPGESPQHFWQRAHSEAAGFLNNTNPGSSAGPTFVEISGEATRKKITEGQSALVSEISYHYASRVPFLKENEAKAGVVQQVIGGKPVMRAYLDPNTLSDDKSRFELAARLIREYSLREQVSSLSQKSKFYIKGNNLPKEMIRDMALICHASNIDVHIDAHPEFQNKDFFKKELEGAGKRLRNELSDKGLCHFYIQKTEKQFVLERSLNIEGLSKPEKKSLYEEKADEIRASRPVSTSGASAPGAGAPPVAGAADTSAPATGTAPLPGVATAAGPGGEVTRPGGPAPDTSVPASADATGAVVRPTVHTSRPAPTGSGTGGTPTPITTSTVSTGTTPTTTTTTTTATTTTSTASLGGPTATATTPTPTTTTTTTTASLGGVTATATRPPTAHSTVSLDRSTPKDSDRRPTIFERPGTPVVSTPLPADKPKSPLSPPLTRTTPGNREGSPTVRSEVLTPPNRFTFGRNVPVPGEFTSASKRRAKTLPTVVEMPKVTVEEPAESLNPTRGPIITEVIDKPAIPPKPPEVPIITTLPWESGTETKKPSAEQPAPTEGKGHGMGPR